MPGKTYEDVYKFFKGKNDKKEEWGKFSPTTPKLGFTPRKGEPITEVSVTLGHRSPGVTLNVYSHAIPARSGTSEAMQRLLG